MCGGPRTGRRERERQKRDEDDEREIKYIVPIIEGVVVGILLIFGFHLSVFFLVEAGSKIREMTGFYDRRDGRAGVLTSLVFPLDLPREVIPAL